MFISDFAIKRPIITVVTMVALVVFGLVALINLKTDEFPDVQPPLIVRSAILYPGASPETVEREIVEPIEEAISAISGVDRRRPQATPPDGLAQFIVGFEFEKPMQEATQDIRDAISTIRDRPAAPRWRSRSSDAVRPGRPPIVSLALSSTTLPAGGADAARRPRHHARAAVAAGRGRGDGGRRHRAGADGRAPARGAAGGGGERGPGGAGAAGRRTSPRRWAGSNGPLDERTHPAQRPAGRRRRTSATWSWRERGGRLIRLGEVADVRRRHRGAAHHWRCSTARRRSASTSRSPRATAPPTVSGRMLARVAAIRADAARRARSSTMVQDAGDAGATRSVRNVRGDAGRGRAAHGAGGVPVPQLVALDGDHRPGAAGDRAGVVHRGLGLRLHAQHDVAARASRSRSAS